MPDIRNHGDPSSNEATSTDDPIAYDGSFASPTMAIVAGWPVAPLATGAVPEPDDILLA
jgi:hypothetical protein